MKKIFFLFVFSLFLFAEENPFLIEYARKYTMSKNTDTYKLAYDFANSSIDFSKLESWERQRYRSINKKELKKNIESGTEYEYVLSLINPSPEYRRLKKILDGYYKREKEYREYSPRLYRAVRYGKSYPEIKRLKKYLRLIQGAEFEFYDGVYDDDLVREIENFQRNHGLYVDGKIGPVTRKFLNISFDELVRKIKINLEIEMSKKDKPNRYIYVNIPEFKMYLIDNDTEMLSMDVIVGKKTNKTPIFNETLSYVVVNPEWIVPENIYNKEYKNKSFQSLKRRGFDFNEEGKLVQLSGERNALGLVKFMFPNKFSVYMHDTPNKKLFNRTVRAFSHGCIRLSEPFDLMDYLGVGYDEYVNNEKVDLEEDKIPVYIEYNTAWIDSYGNLQLREDIYDYEKKLFDN